MQKKFWFPKTMPERLTFFQNFRAKIGAYQSELEFSPEQIAAMEIVADEFIASYGWVKSCEATLKAAFAWRDGIYGSASAGSGVLEAPAFPPPPVVSGANNIIEAIYAFRRQIVTRPGYTESIGRDLGIIGAAKSKTRLAEISPSLRISVSEGNQLSVAGSMQKMPAMMIEYKPENGQWSTAGFLTNLPGTINISPADAAGLERGSVRAVFFQKNAKCGSYSSEYPVVLY
jgi:hypothetical protein